jgi:hypothetical protein
MAESTTGLPLSGVPFFGTGVTNGIPVNRSNAGYKTIGGIVDPNDSNNDDLIPYFGSVVSRDPTAAPGLFALGKPAGYVESGVLVFDASVAQNDPAKSNYVLTGLPTTVLYEGTVQLDDWTTTQSGAIQPIPGAVVIYRALGTGTGSAPRGAIEFLPAGTLESAIPTGWAAFPGYVVEVTEYGQAKIECNFNTGEASVPVSPQLFTATLTAAAAATPVPVIPAASVGAGKKIYVTDVILTVNGATAWTDVTATVVNLQDTADTPVVLSTYAKAGLTGNATLGTLGSNITPGTPLRTGVGLTTAKGLDIAADANFAAGSNIIVTVVAFIQ